MKNKKTIFIRENFFVSPLIRKILVKLDFFENKNKLKTDYLLENFNYKEINFSSFYKKKIYYTAENLYNKVILSNFIAKININLFNKIYNYLPNFLLNIPIWHLHKKHLKYLNKKNCFFIITNHINKENVFILPFFMHWINTKYSELKLKKISKFKTNKKFCAFIVSNPSNLERLEFYKKLSKYKKIDSFGKIFNNINFTNREDYMNNSKLYENYKFVICFENSYEKDYITEKLPNAMLGATIPIYKGASNVKDYFNTESFINYDDYGSFDKMIEKIIELDKDDNKYLEMLNKPYLSEKNIENIKNKEKDLEFFFRKIFK